MTDYLALLKKMQKMETANVATAKAAKSPFDSFGSSRGGRFSEIEGAPAVILTS